MQNVLVECPFAMAMFFNPFEKNIVWDTLKKMYKSNGTLVNDNEL